MFTLPQHTAPVVRQRHCKPPMTWPCSGRNAILPAMQTTSLLDYARQLDREADHALHVGHHAAAERLAHRAAELRGAP